MRPEVFIEGSNHVRAAFAFIRSEKIFPWEIQTWVYKILIVVCLNNRRYCNLAIASRHNMVFYRVI